jgi:hypothetical protein
MSVNELPIRLLAYLLGFIDVVELIPLSILSKKVKNSIELVLREFLSKRLLQITNEIKMRKEKKILSNECFDSIVPIDKPIPQMISYLRSQIIFHSDKTPNDVQ